MSSEKLVADAEAAIENGGKMVADAIWNFLGELAKNNYFSQIWGLNEGRKRVAVASIIKAIKILSDKVQDGDSVNKLFE